MTCLSDYVPYRVSPSIILTVSTLPHMYVYVLMFTIIVHGLLSLPCIFTSELVVQPLQEDVMAVRNPTQRGFDFVPRDGDGLESKKIL